MSCSGAALRVLAGALDRPKSSADVIPIGHQARKPLGLGIIPGDDNDEREAASAKRAIGEEVDELVRVAVENLGGEENCKAYHPTMMDELFGFGTALKIAMEGDDDLHRAAKVKFGEVGSEIAALRLENAQLRASVGELTAKVGELSFVTERLRVEGRGPPGVAGPRGVDGRDGARGPRGERGERGPAGPRPVSFDTDAEAFAVTGLMSDGRRAPTMHLRALFEAYHAQVEGEAAAEEHDAVQAQRAVVEREAERVRVGLPAR